MFTFKRKKQKYFVFNIQPSFALTQNAHNFFFLLFVFSVCIYNLKKKQKI